MTEYNQNHTLGDVVDCTIEKIDPAGVYIDMGGVKGIIHLSQVDGMNMAYKDRGLKLGQQIKAKIVGIAGTDTKDPKNVSLSITAMLDSSVNPGSTGEDFGGVAPSNTESDGEKFGATEANHKKPRKLQ